MTGVAMYASMRDMDRSGVSGRDHPMVAEVLRNAFAVLVFDGASWMRVGGEQADARTACMCVVAWIHMLEPNRPLRDLQERAEASVRALEDGAGTVTVIDERHRVDRVGLCTS
jgi:hypothetical protein